MFGLVGEDLSLKDNSTKPIEIKPLILPNKTEITSLGETLDNEKQVKYNEKNGIKILSKTGVTCVWSNPNNNYKDCEEIIEVTNTRDKPYLIDKEPKLTFDSNVQDLSFEYSTTTKPIQETAKNFSAMLLKNDLQIQVSQKEANATSEKQDLETQIKSIETIYSYDKLGFENYQKELPKDIKAGQTIGIKATFKSPIIVEGGYYKNNKFDINFIWQKQGIFKVCDSERGMTLNGKFIKLEDYNTEKEQRRKIMAEAVILNIDERDVTKPR